MPSPWKNLATGILYQRRKVSVDLRETAKGRTLILPVAGKMRTVRVGDAVKVSLGTKDTATAKERIREADAALREEWAKLRQSIATGPVKLTQKQVMALAGEAYRAFTTAFDDEPGPAGRWVNGIRESLIAEQGGHLASLKIGGATEIDNLRTLERMAIIRLILGPLVFLKTSRCLSQELPTGPKVLRAKELAARSLLTLAGACGPP